MMKLTSIRRLGYIVAVLSLFMSGCGGESGGEQTVTTATAPATEPEATEPEATDQPTEPAPALAEPTEVSDFPSQEIRFIVPLKAGSAPDTTFRNLSKLAEAELGHPVVIENKAGAGGTVGLSEIASAEPDGYTIGMGAVAMVTIQPLLQDTTFEGPEDFQPIIQTNAAPMVLFVNADSDIQTIDDFVAAATERPGQISVGMGGGEHTIIHVEVEQLEREAGIELNPVGYNAGEQVIAVLNGSIDAAISQPAIAIKHAEEGSLRILGVFGEEKPEALHDVQLFSEAGYDVPQIPYEFVVGPAGIPSDRVQVIHDAYRTAMESDDFSAYVEQFAVLRQYRGTQELVTQLAEDFEVYEAFVNELGWAQ